ncbi:hypothetical protein IEQ34_010338 [Dendrobium chrysotoxum]|uniref:S-acyltransferase n=1 Tax=Dendrobium chrysotoxum TaxID=161865 RepID=A0AAV7H465_DENCH|nr:hypothetical protein IEQ34_010338 [Dendrobium chrysotoxum]
MAPIPKSKRLYQVWKGDNRFFCGGRCIFGPDVASLFLSMFLIAGPIITFSYQIISKIRNREKHHEDGIHENHHVLGFPVLIVTIIIMIADLTFLLLTSSRDPGIVPRNAQSIESSETSEFNTPSMEWINGRTSQMRLPRTKDIILNGFVIKRNYRFFFLFISTSTFLCIYVFTLSVVNILQERKHYHSFLKLVVGEIISAILMVYSFLSVWFVGGLTVFHFYLICTNQTTYENFRYHYDKKENPFNKGILKNFKEVFLNIPPSMNKFRARVLDQVVEYGALAPNMGMDIVSSTEKFDIETADKLEMGINLQIPAANLDYSSTNENQGAINKHKGEVLDPSDLSKIQENNYQESKEFKQSCTGETETEDEPVTGSVPEEDIHQQTI